MPDDLALLSLMAQRATWDIETFSYRLKRIRKKPSGETVFS